MTTIQLASNATEADIVRALADLPAGGTLIFPENKTISIRYGLDIDVADRDITIDLNGSTLRRAGDVSVIIGRGEHEDARSVQLGADSNGNAVLTYSSAPHGLQAGDWVKIVSDDRLPGDHLDGNLPSRMGQAMEVTSVDGNTVTFDGALYDQANYRSNLRASAYGSGSLIVKNGEIVGDQQHPTWDLPLLQLRSLIDPQVENLTVRDSFGRGISVVDSIEAELTNITARNLLDGSPSALGIAVSSMSSTGTTVKGLYAENVMHASDANAIGIGWNYAHIEHYGGDIGMNVADSVAVGTRNFAWTWHSESVKGKFDNVMAFDSYGFLMGRGIGGEITDSGGAGNERGLFFFEYGDGDARNIAVDGITLRETESYSVFASGDLFNNTLSNSWLESYTLDNLASPDQLTVTSTLFTRAGLNPNDVLTGTAGEDMLLGGRGADTISAGSGNDYLWGGAGGDNLTGGYGRDRFAFHSAGEAADTITDFHSGDGGDILDLSVLAAHYGWAGHNPVAEGYLRFVQSGADVLVQVDRNGGSDDFATLARLEDVRTSELTPQNLRLSLSDGAEVAPSPNPDPNPDPDPDLDGTLRGTEGADLLRGEAGIDHIIGGGGSDRLYAWVGNTLLEGGTGNDGICGNQGNDILKGGTGHDWMSGGGGRDKLYGELGNDTLLGGTEDDSLWGGDGNDTLSGDGGADMLSGSGGYDTASYARSSAGVNVDLMRSWVNTGDAAGDTFSSIENLTGTAFDDTLRGSQIANVLDGGDGDDRLFGRAGGDTLMGGDGADHLDGGAWKDTLTGGAGSDSFYFANIAQAGDTITDFQAGIDNIVLSGAGFGLESLADLSFVEGRVANSTDPTVLFDSEGDRLLWDADGSGADRAVLLANFAQHVNFSIGDILIG